MTDDNVLNMPPKLVDVDAGTPAWVLFVLEDLHALLVDEPDPQPARVVQRAIERLEWIVLQRMTANSDAACSEKAKCGTH